MTRTSAPEAPETTTALRLLRRVTELSMNEVARRSGVPAWRLSLLERGMPPTEEERIKLLTVLAPFVLG